MNHTKSCPANSDDSCNTQPTFEYYLNHILLQNVINRRIIMNGGYYEGAYRLLERSGKLDPDLKKLVEQQEERR